MLLKDLNTGRDISHKNLNKKYKKRLTEDLKLK